MKVREINSTEKGKVFKHGDFSEISRLYCEQHAHESRQISPQYVRRILVDRDTYKSYLADEIEQLAEKYLSVRDNLRELLVSDIEGRQ